MADSSTFHCSICLDTAQEPVVTRCGHLFCWPCLDQWLHTERSVSDCPVCKGGLDVKKDIIPIYGSGRQQFTSSSQGSQEHAFHNRRQRPTPEDVPGPRRSTGLFQSMRPAALAGCPAFFLVGEYSIYIMLIWLAYVLLYPRLVSLLRNAYQGLRRWLAQPNSPQNNPNNEVVVRAERYVNLSLMIAVGLLLMSVVVDILSF